MIIDITAIDNYDLIFTQKVARVTDKICVLDYIVLSDNKTKLVDRLLML